VESVEAFNCGQKRTKLDTAREVLHTCMTTGTIVTMLTSVVTVAMVSLCTMATLVAVCPGTRRKYLTSLTFSDLLFYHCGAAC
jgi:hypothetical protein